MMSDAKEIYVVDRAAWRAWLSENHDKVESVWLIFDKGKDRTITYDEIVEEALCFGWIDSRGGSVDDTKSKLYMAKRKPKSNWSESNKIRVENLKKQGLMTPAGEVAIKIAKTNGQWEK
ncbi:MAG TPA: hypothetical protein VLG47_04240 [Candidatus Saccharimonadales bacterium]|nr:hypothetical protein [Candidatus Saccharimonadales bacterium]